MSNINHFGDKRHVLTPEDRMKGRRTKSWKRTLSNRINAMKNGKYSKGIKECVNCKVSFTCPFRSRKPSAECVLFGAKTVYKIMLARNLKSIEQFDVFISDYVASYLKAQNNELQQSAAELHSLIEKTIEIREILKE
jgi:hypothetical protein